MANSNNGALKHGENEDHKRGEPKNEAPGQSSKEPRASVVPRDSKEPAKQVPGRPRKQSRRGKGGGPKTKAGKAAVSRNAIKHGIHAIHPVVIADFESVEEWDDFYEGFRESLLPEGAVEEDIVYNLATNRWRQRRVIHSETAEINEQVWKTADDLGFADAYANSIT